LGKQTESYDKALNIPIVKMTQTVNSPSSGSLNQQLLQLFNLLFDNYGPQNWWPGESPFEVIIGAILTQSAAWTNVEKAIYNVKKADLLNPVSLRSISNSELAELIFPSGYYNAKARKIKAFVEHLGSAHLDSLENLFSADIDQLRNELLSIHGIGPETADSIILYAAGKPIFVIDAYTVRLLSRIGISPSRNCYNEFQALFMDNLPSESYLFNEYHALLVRHGKEICRKKPLCDKCCLTSICSHT